MIRWARFQISETLLIYQGRPEPGGPHDHSRKNGENELVSAEMNTENHFSHKRPKTVAVFGHLQVSTRMPTRSAKQSRFSASSHVFVRPRVSIVETAQIKKRNQSPWGAWLRASIQWPDRFPSSPNGRIVGSVLWLRKLIMRVE